MRRESCKGTSSATIIVAVCIVIVCGLAFYALSKRVPDQTESDCSKVEFYDSSARRCKTITGLEYAQKWAAIDENNVTYGREHATVCTPANEINSTYIGKYRLVCYRVESVYDTGRGTVFLNSGRNRGDFTSVSFRYDPLTYNDAQSYLGKYIGVYGNISSYEGQIEIIIDYADQITLNPNTYYEGYTKDELLKERSACFDKEIKNAIAKEDKDKILSKCRILTLKNLLDEDSYDPYY